MFGIYALTPSLQKFGLYFLQTSFPANVQKAFYFILAAIFFWAMVKVEPRYYQILNHKLTPICH